KPIGRHEPAVQAERPQALIRELRERLQVHDVFHVVLEEKIQGVVITLAVRAPEPHRVEASEARRLLAPNDPHLGFDRLEATDETESPQRMHEVEVDLVQGHSRERLPQERHVEARAVECYEEFCPPTVSTRLQCERTSRRASEMAQPARER